MPMLSHKICDVDSSLHFELGCFCGEHVQLIKRRMLDIYIYIYITAKKRLVILTTEWLPWLQSETVVMGSLV